MDLVRLLKFALFIAAAVVAISWIQYAPHVSREASALKDAQEEALRAAEVGTPEHSCAAASTYAWELQKAKGVNSPEYRDQNRRADMICAAIVSQRKSKR